FGNLAHETELIPQENNWTRKFRTLAHQRLGKLLGSGTDCFFCCINLSMYVFDFTNLRLTNTQQYVYKNTLLFQRKM
ncbi:MAG: hypothetical protein AAFP02_22620, partial [Bacteroidota bacterium]